MDAKWTLVLVTVLLHHKVTSGAYTVQTPSEGQEVDIECNPGKKGTMVVWFRVLDKTGMQFIASFTNNGVVKTQLPSAFRSKMNQDILTLRSFSEDDSGVYGCASLIRGVELLFGPTTRLNAKKAPVEQPQGVNPTPGPVIRTTTTPCSCTVTREVDPSMSCPLLILGPLVGGCGLLLLLLIIITLYCNKMRTRRCPHHYKRKPRMTEPGKQVRPNSHI